MHTVKTVLSTLVVTAIVGVAGAVAFIYSGIYDVSASTPDNPIVAWAVHQTSEASVGARLGINKVPADLDRPETIRAGGQLFAQSCTVCHGAPEKTPSAIAAGLNPQPPNLLSARRKPDPAENFQFIKYGVKMTGMPSFAKSYSDTQIWQLVAFLNKLPGISAPDYAALTASTVN